MASRGRKPLTEEALQARLADYCARYQVHERNPEGFPVYPGNREGAQHRDWIALYKAWRRVRDREPVDATALLARLATQRGRCPVCDEALEAADAVAVQARQEVLAHAACARLLRELRKPGMLERVQRLLA